MEKWKNLVKNIFFIFLILSPFVVSAESGACSSHGGVSCGAGPDYDGSVICNDGWRDSEVNYYSMSMCVNPVYQSSSYPQCDKYRTNPNLSKSLAKARYDACVYTARQEAGAQAQQQFSADLQKAEVEIQQRQQQMDDWIKQLELEEQRRQEENQLWLDSLINSQKTPVCPTNSFLGNDRSCYCNAGYEVSGNKCVLYTPKCQEGYYMSSSNGLCMPTQQQCKKEYGNSAKLNNKGECLYCPDGYFLNNDWMCEPYQSKDTIDQKDNLETKISENKETSISSSTPKYFWYLPDYPATKKIKNFFKWIFD